MPVVGAVGMLVPPQNPQTLAVQDWGDFPCAVTFHSQENSHISKDKWGDGRGSAQQCPYPIGTLEKGLTCNWVQWWVCGRVWVGKQQNGAG